ncbi:MAG: FecR domain-containing protein [Ekhidna sp.]|nr:FecR domain-containing protein [Ekhidna sp.]
MEEALVKYFSGEASDDEIRLVESWRSESETNANMFFESKEAWLSTEPIEEPPKHILESILAEPQGRQVPFMLRSWVKYASAAVLVLAISLLFVLNNKTEQDGMTTTKVLADGSEVVLHGDSELTVLDFNEGLREVRITGKAYFDIERDESRPFIIYTENSKVQVLGTSFVVDASKDDTEVLVESGLVEFTKESKKAGSEVAVRLAKGESGLVSKRNKGIIKKNIKDPNYLAWKTKVITFKGSTMSEVEQVLEDVYGIDLNFENADFKNCKLTARFNKKKVKDAIEIISRTFDVDYDVKGDKITLKGKGC